MTRTHITRHKCLRHKEINKTWTNDSEQSLWGNVEMNIAIHIHSADEKEARSQWRYNGLGF